MKRDLITRRDCLTILGGSAASLMTATSSSAAPRAPESQTAQKIVKQNTPAGLQGTAEQLKELSVSRVFALTPVQQRPEFVAGLPQSAPSGVQITLLDEWDFAEADPTLMPGQYAADTAWLKTSMPKPVQYVLMEAQQVPNLWYGDNFLRLQWIQQRDWHLRRRFQVPADWRDAVIRLRFDGMDYQGMVWLDGEFLGSHEGSFGGPTFDITQRVAPGQEHELLVRLVHEPHDMIPNYQTSTDDHNPRVIKPDAEDAESYQWGNRYRSMGLFQPIRLLVTGGAFLEAPFVRTDAIASGGATLWAQAMVTNTGAIFDGVIDAKIVDAATNAVAWQQQFRQKVPAGMSFWEHELTLANPKLWWPNGLGEQPLYRLELKLLREGAQLDFISSRFGIRTLQLKRNPSFPENPRTTPDDRTLEDEAYQYLWVANGRPFYVKGASWMTSDDILLLSRDREDWLVRAAKMNGLNLLRLNGGTAIFESEQFYDLCDENGIIVWQEVPLNWVNTPGTTNLNVWREQLTQTALRTRQHPSLGIFVGGNEFDPFADGIEPFLGLVREIFAGFAGHIPFRMNSPCGGDYHAYDPQSIYTADENWYHRIYDRGHYFISEWSFSSFANMSLLKRMIPAEELARAPVGYDVEVFKRRYTNIRERSAELWYTFVKSWDRASWYGDLGKADLEHLVNYSQMCYEHNIACVFEQWRAQFPYTGGQALWTYNSLGPVTNSWAIIDWCGQPQIPFYAAKRANEPVHVMADCGFFSWGPGDTFRASVFAINDEARVCRGARITARILDQQLQKVHEDSWSTDVPASGHAGEAHEIQWPIPANLPEGYFFLELTLATGDGSRLSRRAYWLRSLHSLADPAARRQWQAQPVLEPLTQTGPWLRPQIEQLPTALRSHANFRQKNKKEAELILTVENTGTRVAYPVSIELLPDIYSALWTDNYFWLAPGETATLQGIVRLDMQGLDPITNPAVAQRSDLSLRVSAWNAPAVILHL